MTARPLDPTGQALRLLVLLRRYENQLEDDTAAVLAETRDRLVFLLERQDLTLVTPGRVPRRFDAVTAKADEALLAAYQRLNAHVREALARLAVAQAQATGRGLERLLGDAIAEVGPLRLPTRAQLRAIATTQPVRGAVMWDWWRRQRLQTRQAFQTQLRLGLSQGESIDELVRRIRGRALGGGRYEGGVMQVTTRNAQALVRTAANQTANAASFATYQANPDVSAQYEYLATLDTRTTPICASLDGKRFRYDDPTAPRPPQHYGCRSTITPVVRWASLGLKPPPARETYPAWFARQPAAVQDDILGPGRAQLVRRGQAGLADLIRSDGSTITLAELERAAAD